MLLGVFNRDMSNADSIYTAINNLRDGIYAELGHTAPLAPLGADHWTEDEVAGRSLGDPNMDWCVDVVDGDLVRVFAAGDVVAEAVIDGAGSL